MRKGQKNTKETIEKIKSYRAGQNPPNLGREWSDEYKENMSLVKTGKKNPKIAGFLNPNWKGGIYPENERIRKSFEYKLWRESVFERDKYTCIWCNQKGVKLQADHIKPFALFPELRFAIDNGRTLCIECHKKIGYWGRPKKL